MSADNYIFVRKRPDGLFGISHRFASTYYDDEGWSVKNPPTYMPFGTSYPQGEEKHPEWITPAPNDRETFADINEALIAAHRFEQELGVVEYGVSLGEGVL